MNLDQEFADSYSAWYTGFRTALDTVTVMGKPLQPEEYELFVESELFWRLSTLVNIGRDQPHGIWHLTGARMAVYMASLTQWDYTLTDDNSMRQLFATIEHDNPEVVCARIADDLSERLGIIVTYLPGPASRLVRHWIKKSSDSA